MSCSLPLKNRDGSPIRNIQRPSLATDKVRFVGDPVAFVVAETRAAARDGAEAVFLDVDTLPAVTEASAAAGAGRAAALRPPAGQRGAGLPLRRRRQGGRGFAGAAHVTRLSIRNNRVVVCAMEPRSAIGEYDPAPTAGPCTSAARACSASAGRWPRTS
jgi:carbon-monoxide dehydrogenase large subunit